MKDMESQGKRFCFPRLAFCSQWSDHHVQGIFEEGLHSSLYDLGLEQPKADTLPHHNQLIDAPLWGSPTGTFNWGVCPLHGMDGCAQLAGKQLCHPLSGPGHGDAVYITLSDDIDHSTDSAGPHNQRNPPSKIRLIGHHLEHRVFVISCYTPHLNVQDDKPKWASTFLTPRGSTGSPWGLPEGGQGTHTAAPERV